MTLKEKVVKINVYRREDREKDTLPFKIGKHKIRYILTDRQTVTERKKKGEKVKRITPFFLFILVYSNDVQRPEMKQLLNLYELHQKYLHQI
jgi:hypothetical protein